MQVVKAGGEMVMTLVGNVSEHRRKTTQNWQDRGRPQRILSVEGLRKLKGMQISVLNMFYILMNKDTRINNRL